jgi:hypothetical protein
MKKLFLLAAVIAGFTAITSCGDGTSAKKGDAIEVSIDSLINDASALVGKTVRFEATVDHACMHGGKRLTVFGSEKGKTLKIDGTEDSPNFESSLMGKQVEVIGTVRKVAGEHVADCEEDEGNEVPEVAYVIECIDYKAL